MAQIEKEPCSSMDQTEKKEKTELRKRKIIRGLIIASAIIVVLSLLASLIDPNTLVQKMFGEKDPDGKKPYFYDLDDPYNYLDNPKYLEKDTRLFVNDPYTGETYSVEKQDLDKEDAYVSFFYNYFEAIKNGDCDAIADMYAPDYEDVPSDFTVQMIYDMQISQSMDYESGLVFRVDYKIYRNNGTFRDDVGSDTTRSLSFTLIREGETLKIQSIRPYTSYVRN